jgi:alpha-galactosidase
MEIFLLDAGWYKGTPTASYSDMGTTWDAISSSLGNWEQGEERSRFPSGLSALAQQVRSKGMQFGLWFEPERAGPESLLAKQHPDWMTYVPKRKWALVDFSKPEVQEYFCRVLDRYIGELGLRYIRWDCNTEDFSPYWALRDTPDRKGISEIRHLEGLHRVEDYIRQRYPGVIFESCAGGGNRIDLATLERRHTIWISDQTMDAQLVRFHLEGLNHFLPGSGQGVAFAPRPNTYRQPGFVFPDIAWQACFGGAFGAAGRLHEWPVTMREQAHRHYSVFKQLRRFLSEDFYLLLPQARSLESWSGWQFHDPKAQAGFVQAFRLRSPEPVRKLVLRGLDAASEYILTDAYTGMSFDASGAKLISEGLEFSLSPLTSRVLLYTQKP